MPSCCERPGCSAEAVASWGFDARRLLVWLDRLEPDGRTEHGLCAVHAARLRPPRDWWLDDRRVDPPPLFPDAPRSPSPTGRDRRRAPGSPGRRRRRDAAPTPEPAAEPPVAPPVMPTAVLPDDQPLPFPPEP
jgi:hypothetical protein